MPIYEYECQACRERFEYLLRGGDERPECPKCGSGELEKQMSAPAAPQMAQGGPVACGARRGDRPCDSGGGCGGCPCGMGH